MPMPRRKADRLKQVAAWLRDTFPTPFPVYVRMVDRRQLPEQFGDTLRRGRRIRIRILGNLPWHTAVETLLHEWAHAVCWTFEHVESWKPDHDDHWAVTYGRIYRHFYDLGGAEASRTWPWK